MKVARKFLLLTILLIILFALLFVIPDSFGGIKVSLEILCLFILVGFMAVFWKWRRNLGPDEKKELEL
jgi:uncharacterized membrane protein